MSELIKVESNGGGIKNATYSSIGLACINMGLEQLKHYKEIGSSSQPEELDWEIKLYEWILSRPNPEATAYQYLEAREERIDGKFERLLEKREVVSKLGWVIE